MTGHPVRLTSPVLLVALSVSLGSGQDDPKQAQGPAKHPDQVFRTFDMNANEPQISQRLADLRKEGWALAGNYVDSASNSGSRLVGVFSRPYRDVLKAGYKPVGDEEALMTFLRGEWKLVYLREYGKKTYAYQPDTSRSPVRLTFTGNGFSMTQDSTKEKHTTTGTVQYIRREVVVKEGIEGQVTPSACYAVDLLIEKERKDEAGKPASFSSPYFTVRTLFLLDRPGTQTIRVVSGGLKSERPRQEDLRQENLRSTSERVPPALATYQKTTK